VLGCGSDDQGSGTKPSEWNYPLDEQIRVNQLQLKATHNSYHIAQHPEIAALDYTHAPLDVQLRTQGVRGFELDTSWDATVGAFVIVHILGFDNVSTCSTLTDCLGVLKAWSDANPAHHLLILQIEPKDTLPTADAEQYFTDFESAITSVWPRERIVTPDDVRQGAATLREGITASGWPTLAQTRGKLLIYIDNKSDFRNLYTRSDHDVDGRVAFPSSDPGKSYEGVYVLNDPIDDASAIDAAISGGFIVRTRADADNVEPLANDTGPRDAALASGAQIISTDYPAKVEGLDYWVEIPGGTPSRCNPQNAPAECTSEAIENAAFIH
jgi:hypothetical protein